MGPKRANNYYFPQAGPFNPFPNPNYEKIDFSFFLKNTPILDRLSQNGSKSPEMAPPNLRKWPSYPKITPKIDWDHKKGG